MMRCWQIEGRAKVMMRTSRRQVQKSARILRNNPYVAATTTATTTASAAAPSACGCGTSRVHVTCTAPVKACAHYRSGHVTQSQVSYSMHDSIEECSNNTHPVCTVTLQSVGNQMSRKKLPKFA